MHVLWARVVQPHLELVVEDIRFEQMPAQALGISVEPGRVSDPERLARCKEILVRPGRLSGNRDHDQQKDQNVFHFRREVDA